MEHKAFEVKPFCISVYCFLRDAFPSQVFLSCPYRSAISLRKCCGKFKPTPNPYSLNPFLMFHAPFHSVHGHPSISIFRHLTIIAQVNSRQTRPIQLIHILIPPNTRRPRNPIRIREHKRQATLRIRGAALTINHRALTSLHRHRPKQTRVNSHVIVCGICGKRFGRRVDVEGCSRGTAGVHGEDVV